MCVRDEADLLPEVLEHLDGKLDALYAYEDGSQDKTWDILMGSSVVTNVIQRATDSQRQPIMRPNYHRLLEEIRNDYDYENEDVWVVITMGDRFYLNKTPREIVEGAGEYEAVEGVQLDFLRHRMDPWTEDNDEWPYYTESLRHQCRWFRVDERCIVAYKVTPELSYRVAKYPWPRGIASVQNAAYSMEDKLSLDIPYLEHQGRRSPRAAQWRYSSGSRPISQKYQHWDLGTFESTSQALKQHYQNYRLFPWVGIESLETLVEWWNVPEFHTRANMRWFFKGLETGRIGTDWHRRYDI